MKFSLSIFLVFSLYSLAQTYDDDSAKQLLNVPPGYGVFEGVTPANPFNQVGAPESKADNYPQIYAENPLSQYAKVAKNSSQTKKPNKNPAKAGDGNIPTCKNSGPTVPGTDGRKFGYENGKSCIAPNQPNGGQESPGKNPKPGVTPQKPGGGNQTTDRNDGRPPSGSKPKPGVNPQKPGGDNPTSDRDGGQQAGRNPTTSAGFISGRASFYPGPGEAPTDMSNLACRTQAKTQYFGAISDQSPIFNGPPCRANPNGGHPDCPNQGSCGKCFQVRCVSKFMWYDPSNKNDKSSCVNPGKSVVIQIADACPSIHEVNRNKGNQNPCGASSKNLNHIDLNREAFREIAKEGDGIIHMEFKQVDCSVGLGIK